MKEKGEMLAQQVRSASASGPTIDLVTPGARRNNELNGPCPPNCPPWRPCGPQIFPGPCDPDFRLPRPPRP